MQKLSAEFIGTLILVLCGCGAAVLSTALPNGGGIGLLGVAFAFGLTVVGVAYALGSVSGAHLNPAVTIALALNQRISYGDVIPYIIAQVLGGIAGAGILFLIASGKAGFTDVGDFASIGFGEHSPAGYSLQAGFVAELVFTGLLVFVILATTHQSKGVGNLAPLAIGLTLVVLVAVSAPITNGALNPARATATAVFAGGWAIDQLWLSWVAPILGGIVFGMIYKCLFCCSTCQK